MLSANRVDFGFFLFHNFPIIPPPLFFSLSLSFSFYSLFSPIVLDNIPQVEEQAAQVRRRLVETAARDMGTRKHAASRAALNSAEDIDIQLSNEKVRTEELETELEKAKAEIQRLTVGQMRHV